MSDPFTFFTVPLATSNFHYEYKPRRGFDSGGGRAQDGCTEKAGSFQGRLQQKQRERERERESETESERERESEREGGREEDSKTPVSVWFKSCCIHPPPLPGPAMTLFKSEHRTRHISMTGELKSSRPKAGPKRTSSMVHGSDYDLDYDCYQHDFYDRVYDYQRVPAPLPPIPHGPSPAKRHRSSSSWHRSRDRLASKSRPSSSSSSRAKLKMEELQTIKRELTLIKVQIDDLLDSLDRMDRHQRDPTGSPPSRDGSLSASPYHGPASSPERSSSSHSPRRHTRRESPELGEASDDDSHRLMNPHSSDLDDDM
ncbi:RNA-binding Raly-like protein [Arapaima gigas]